MRERKSVEDEISRIGGASIGAGIIYAFIRPFLQKKQQGGGGEGESPIPTLPGEGPYPAEPGEGDTPAGGVPGEVPIVVPPIDLTPPAQPPADNTPANPPDQADEALDKYADITVTAENYDYYLSLAADIRALRDELQADYTAGRVTKAEYDYLMRRYRRWNQDIGSAIKAYQNGV